MDAIEAATRLPFEAGCRRERELFFECVRGEQAKALIHVFFAERAASKLPEDTAHADARPRSARSRSSAPARWGRGIAMACANAGLEVILTDATGEALTAGDAAIRRNYDASVAARPPHARRRSPSGWRASTSRRPRRSPRASATRIW